MTSNVWGFVCVVIALFSCEREHKAGIVVLSGNLLFKFADSCIRTHDSLYDNFMATAKNDDMQKAGKCLDEILRYEPALFSDSQCVRVLAKAYFRLGDYNNVTGSFTESKKYFEKFLLFVNDRRIASMPRSVAFAYKSLGNIFSMFGDFKKAELHLQHATELWQQIPDTTNLLSDAINLSIVYKETRQFAHAVGVLRRGFLFAGRDSARKASLYIEMAENYLLAEKPQFVRSCLDTAHKLLYPLAEAPNINEKRGALLQGYGLLKLYENNPDEAIIFFRNGLSQMQKTDKTGRMAGKLMLHIAKGYWLLQQTDSALFYANNALLAVAPSAADNTSLLPGKENAGPENTIIEALDLKAAIMTAALKKSGDSALAKMILQCYDIAFESERKLLINFSYDESRLNLMEECRQRSEKAIAVCNLVYTKYSARHFAEQAFNFAERSKALLLLSSVKNNFSNHANLEQDTIYQALQSLKIQLAFIKRNAVGKNNPDVKALSLLSDAVPVEREIALLEAKLNSANPQFSSWIREQDIADAGLVKKELIDEKTALLEYFYGDDASYVFILEKSSTSMYQLSSRLDTLITEFTPYVSRRENFVNNPDGYSKTAYSLYKTLAADKVYNKERLIVIPDGTVATMPFEALVTDAVPGKTDLPNYLVNEKEISYAYSASLLLAPHKQGGMSTLAAFAPFSDTAVQGQPALPGTANEITIARNNFSESFCFTDTSATITNFREKAACCDIIHLATHAYAGDNNRQPYLFFYDSTLYLDDLYAMNLQAKLVILSACQTGSGQIQKGEGIMSLARGFRYAGTRNIIQSLWVINDQSAATLFTFFYKNLHGHSYAAALRKAKIDYLKAQTNPALLSPCYWAGFIYIGDMDKEKSSKNGIGILLYALIAVVVITVTVLCWRLSRATRLLRSTKSQTRPAQ